MSQFSLFFLVGVGRGGVDFVWYCHDANMKGKAAIGLSHWAAERESAQVQAGKYFSGR